MGHDERKIEESSKGLSCLFNYSQLNFRISKTPTRHQDLGNSLEVSCGSRSY